MSKERKKLSENQKKELLLKKKERKLLVKRISLVALAVALLVGLVVPFIGATSLGF